MISRKPFAKRPLIIMSANFELSIDIVSSFQSVHLWLLSSMSCHYEGRFKTFYSFWIGLHGDSSCLITFTDIINTAYYIYLSFVGWNVY